MKTTEGQTVLTARELPSAPAHGAGIDRTATRPGRFTQLMRRMLAAYVRRFEHIGGIPLN